MAYQPKYAQKKPDSVRSEARKPERPREQALQEQKKPGKGMLIFFIILGIVVIPVSSFLTV